MPLAMAKSGEVNQIKRVGGKEETRRFLESLGFVPGGEVTIISKISGNVIVNVKESGLPSAARWQIKFWSEGETLRWEH